MKKQINKFIKDLDNQIDELLHNNKLSEALDLQIKILEKTWIKRRRKRTSKDYADFKDSENLVNIQN